MPADPTTLRERVARVVFTGGINQHDLAAIDAAIRIVVEACAEACTFSAGIGHDGRRVEDLCIRRIRSLSAPNAPGDEAGEGA